MGHIEIINPKQSRLRFEQWYGVIEQIFSFEFKY